MTHQGTVVRYDETRGIGFIQEICPERTPQQYFHVSNVENRLTLKAGDAVTFQIRASVRHPERTEAFDVRLGGVE